MPPGSANATGDTRPAHEAEPTSAARLGAARLLALAETTTRLLIEARDSLADVDLAVGILMDRYTMTENGARTLISQLARQNDVTEAAAAQSLLVPDAAR